MKGCVFCAAMAGQVPLAKVYEDPQLLAFLDHRPVFPGHVLLIPKRHMVTLDELLPAEVSPLFDLLRVVSRAVPRAVDGQGCFVANNNVISQSIPHLHWHAVPRSKGDGLKGFFWPRQPYRDEEHREAVRRTVEQTLAQELILDFWFGPPQPNGLAPENFRKRWFAQDPLFDEEIRLRFGAQVEEAVAGGLVDWESSARGRLALILLLDQFTRNLFRHTGRAFVGDTRAQSLALEGLPLSDSLTLDQRVFWFLPFEHGESSAWQELSLHHYARLIELAPPDQRHHYENFSEYARKHSVIIERFGRYPHRNQALQRPSTAEESEFLSGPDSSFW
jgi:uncharacterized protein (DUF924 family)/diadenosine tetraphosphate (Ap4A) HIT family hydrolase